MVWAICLALARAVLYQSSASGGFSSFNASLSAGLNIFGAGGLVSSWLFFIFLNCSKKLPSLTNVFGTDGFEGPATDDGVAVDGGEVAKDSFLAVSTSSGFERLPLKPLQNKGVHDQFDHRKMESHHRFLKVFNPGLAFGCEEPRDDEDECGSPPSCFFDGSRVPFNLASISAFFRAMMAACSDIWVKRSGLPDAMVETQILDYLIQD